MLRNDTAADRLQKLYELRDEINTARIALANVYHQVNELIRETDRQAYGSTPGGVYRTSVKPVDPNSPTPYCVTRDGIDFDVVMTERGAPALAVSKEAFECLAHTQRPLCDFTSDCPAGYDTVLGYMARKNPVALGLIEDYAEGTRRDGFWLAARAGDRAVKVEAPKVLQEQGIYRVNAYPVELLQRRMGF
jgi:hypothetical protein